MTWVVVALAVITALVAVVIRLDGRREFGPKAGDLFVVAQGDGTFRVNKVLAVDAKAIHLRSYSNGFSSRPSDVEESSLRLDASDQPEPGIGHMPMSWRTFRSWDPTFLKRSVVQPGELEGYEIWKESGGGVWDG